MTSKMTAIMRIFEPPINAVRIDRGTDAAPGAEPNCRLGPIVPVVPLRFLACVAVRRHERAHVVPPWREVVLDGPQLDVPVNEIECREYVDLGALNVKTDIVDAGKHVVSAQDIIERRRAHLDYCTELAIGLSLGRVIVAICDAGERPEFPREDEFHLLTAHAPDACIAHGAAAVQFQSFEILRVGLDTQAIPPIML